MQAVLVQNLNQINTMIEENSPIRAFVSSTIGGETREVNATIGNFYQTYQPVISGGGAQTIAVQAAENLSAYRPITICGFHADSNNPAHRGKVCGIATDAATTGFNCDVQPEGTIQNPAWTWTPGDPIFIRGTQLSNLAPTPAESKWSQKIGTAIKTDTILIEISDPVLL